MRSIAKFVNENGGLRRFAAYPPYALALAMAGVVAARVTTRVTTRRAR